MTASVEIFRLRIGTSTFPAVVTHELPAAWWPMNRIQTQVGASRPAQVSMLMAERTLRDFLEAYTFANPEASIVIAEIGDLPAPVQMFDLLPLPPQPLEIRVAGTRLYRLTLVDRRATWARAQMDSALNRTASVRDKVVGSPKSYRVLAEDLLDQMDVIATGTTSLPAVTHARDVGGDGAGLPAVLDDLLTEAGFVLSYRLDGTVQVLALTASTGPAALEPHRGFILDGGAGWPGEPVGDWFDSIAMDPVAAGWSCPARVRVVFPVHGPDFPDIRWWVENIDAPANSVEFPQFDLPVSPGGVVEIGDPFPACLSVDGEPVNASAVTARAQWVADRYRERWIPGIVRARLMGAQPISPGPALRQVEWTIDPVNGCQTIVRTHPDDLGGHRVGARVSGDARAYQNAGRQAYAASWPVLVPGRIVSALPVSGLNIVYSAATRDDPNRTYTGLVPLFRPEDNAVHDLQSAPVDSECLLRVKYPSAGGSGGTVDLLSCAEKPLYEDCGTPAPPREDASTAIERLFINRWGQPLMSRPPAYWLWNPRSATDPPLSNGEFQALNGIMTNRWGQPMLSGGGFYLVLNDPDEPADPGMVATIQRVIVNRWGRPLVSRSGNLMTMNGTET